MGEELRDGGRERMGMVMRTSRALKLGGGGGGCRVMEIWAPTIEQRGS